MIAQPPLPASALVATVALSGTRLTARYPEKNDLFIAAAKRNHMGYEGGGFWVRTLGNLSGNPLHRAVDMVRDLLASSFVVDAHEDVIALAQFGDYPPEQRRWILAGKGDFDGWLRLWWGRGEPDFYKRATFIEGSRYDRKTHCVCIPPEMFAEVESFAEMHVFQIHGFAAEIIRTARRQAQSRIVIDVDPAVPVEEPTWRRPSLTADVVSVPMELQEYPTLPPIHTTTALFPHQIPAVNHLATTIAGALFMDMGTGKTRCAIELATQRQARISCIVWFCPVSLKTTAVYEILKHTDTQRDQVYVFDDATTTRDLPHVTWYIVGTESLSSSDRVTLAANSLIDDHTMVVVDESSYIKGHASKRTRRITQMSQHAAYRLILTGTPLTQGVVDLYAQMRFLSPRILGYNSFYSFAANHLEYHPDYPGMIVRAHNTSHLAAKIAPYTYQVRKDECLDLPEKLYDTRYSNMTNEQLKIYQKTKYEILSMATDLYGYELLKLFGALQQIASGFLIHGDDIIEIDNHRLETLSGILHDIQDEDPVIIWCKYVYSLHRITEFIRTEYGVDSVAQYYGKLSESERESEISHWKAGEARFLVATMATGGHGLTLTESAYAVFYENEFSYAHRLQAEDRIHRIGQTRKPTYINIFTDCGIERRISDALTRKEDVVKAFRHDVNRAKDRQEAFRCMAEEL